MGFKITYTSRYTGEKRVHEYRGSRNGAENWARGLSAENNGCRAECVYVSDSPLKARSEPPEHIITVGHDKPGDSDGR